jgi:hypothetical protein
VESGGEPKELNDGTGAVDRAKSRQRERARSHDGRMDFTATCFATTAQADDLVRLATVLDCDELRGAHEAAAIACGYAQVVTDSKDHEWVIGDMRAWGAASRLGYTSTEASALIAEMRAIASVPRADCYCARRGKPCRTVRYYDDHHDYECGLS